MTGHTQLENPAGAGFLERLLEYPERANFQPTVFFGHHRENRESAQDLCGCASVVRAAQDPDAAVGPEHGGQDGGVPYPMR